MRNDKHQIDSHKLIYKSSNNLMEIIMTKALDRLRMITWLIFGLALYLASWFAGIDHPFIKLFCTKQGTSQLLLGSVIGLAVMRLGESVLIGSRPMGEYLARAIIVAGVIIAGSRALIAGNSTKLLKRFHVCGVTCHKNGNNCNGYCTTQAITSPATYEVGLHVQHGIG